MRKTAKTRKELRSTLVLFLSTLALFSLAGVSCKGQEKQPVPQVENKEVNNTSNDEHIPDFFSMDTNVLPGQTRTQVFYEGQLCHWVRTIFEDSRGDLWFGTNHFGVMRYDGTDLQYVSEEQGLKGGRVNTVIEDSDGMVWLGTYNGLYQFDGETYTHFPNKNDPKLDEVWSVLIDEEGLFWVATSDGIVQFDGAKFTNFEMPKANVENAQPRVSHGRVNTLMKDRSGNLWFGTDGYGITVYDGRSFTFFTSENGLADNNVTGLYQDKDGLIWIASMYGGVTTYDGTNFTQLTKDGVIQGEEVSGFMEDDEGSLWFSVENVGVYRYSDEKFILFDADDGLISQGIITMLQDRRGRFWLGGWKGLFRYGKGLSQEAQDLPTFSTVTRSGPWE
ncbi:MAG: two-component regulator propeller domain-containing protein [Bacteroidota bacterium]